MWLLYACMGAKHMSSFQSGLRKCVTSQLRCDLLNAEYSANQLAKLVFCTPSDSESLIKV